nr:hypothetical protein CFP56_68333 [Quercus suber]
MPSDDASVLRIWGYDDAKGQHETSAVLLRFGSCNAHPASPCIPYSPSALHFWAAGVGVGSTVDGYSELPRARLSAKAMSGTMYSSFETLFCPNNTSIADFFPRCTLNISSTLTSYPSYFNSCPDRERSDDSEKPDHQAYCYTIINEEGPERTADQMDLQQVMDECCMGGVFGGFQSCVHFCETERHLEPFNKCLARNGFGPTYNYTGVVRDTYCVRPKKHKDGSAVIETAKSSASTPKTSNKIMAIYGVGMLMLIGLWL